MVTVLVRFIRSSRSFCFSCSSCLLNWGRLFFGYVKFAPISEDISISTSNRELAFGFGFVPGWKLFGRGMSFTLDVANVAFQSKVVNNGLSMTSCTLGIQREF